MSKPRVVIGVPCYRDVAPEVLEDWIRFAYHCGRRLPQYDFLIGIKTKSEQFRARNAIVEDAQRVNADWLLMLDDDMIVDLQRSQGPDNCYDFIDRLIQHGKDICGVLYYQRMGAYAPVLMTAVSETGYRFLHDDEITHGLQPVDVAGGGCLLIKMSVFDRLPFPYFAPEFQFGTDIQVCRAAKAKGFEVWADTSIELGHLKEERTIISSANRAQYRVDAVSEMPRGFVSDDVFSRLIEDAKVYTGYPDLAEMERVGFSFMEARRTFTGSDLEWYRQYPKERVGRQVWYNAGHDPKRRMTAFILGSIDPRKSLKVLDFGCGIGVTAFSLAEKGHRVTACDLDGTGTFEFLQWRTKRHQVPMTFLRSLGDLPQLCDEQYDVIVAMDSLEHIQSWRRVLQMLSDHLGPKGILFCNNGILDDDLHAEHYFADPEGFVKAAVECHLMPYNALTYLKYVPRVSAKPALPELTHA